MSVFALETNLTNEINTGRNVCKILTVEALSGLTGADVSEGLAFQNLLRPLRHGRSAVCKTFTEDCIGFESCVSSPCSPVPGLLCRVLVKRADFSSVCACWILISDVSVSKTWLRKNTARNTSYRSEGS